MTHKDLTTLKAALKILKKGHKPCKDFTLQCSNCQAILLATMLEDELKLQEWIHKWDKKI